MADSVKVRLMIGAREGAAGDVVKVSPERAKQLVDGGVAQPATKPAARKAGVDPDTAVTARSKPDDSDSQKKTTGKSGGGAA